MKKQISSFLVAVLFANTVAQAASASQNVTDHQMQTTVAIYNSFKSMSEMIKILRLAATGSDKVFLSKLEAEVAGKKLPQAKLIDKLVYFVGIDQPLVVLDAKAGKFRYQGVDILFDPHLSLEKNFRNIEVAIKGTKTSLFNVFVPEAQAVVGFELFMIWGIGAMLWIGAGAFGGFCIDDSCPKHVGIGLTWPLVAAYYILKAIGVTAYDKLKEISCSDPAKASQSIQLKLPDKDITLKVDGDRVTSSEPLTTLNSEGTLLAKALASVCSKHPEQITEANAKLKQPSQPNHVAGSSQSSGQPGTR